MLDECKHIRRCPFYVHLLVVGHLLNLKNEGNAKIIKLIARDENVLFSPHTANAKITSSRR